ncbi:MAG: response regulator transcription factor [Granulosicoccus sp.]|nr:response regulator transcription factor [Granulosicoccus sp.]
MSEEPKPYILVVEDDGSLADWMGDYLLKNGFDISIANRGDEAVNLVKIDDPDIVILDINLPNMDGFSVCHEIRKFYSKPVLMLTARGDESDEVTGLEAGANDYLIKPVRPKALLARVNTLLGRTSASQQKHHIREYGTFTIDSESRSVYLDNHLIDLSTHEFDLLWLLSEQAGRVFSRKEMVATLRGIEYDGFDRSVDIMISRLRKKLGDDSSKPVKIKTVWGKGYVFASDAW